MPKVVIIGSGLGGLSCGYILQKNGYDVTILEQGAQIGGCLQCFSRKGAKFETGMHFIGSAKEGQAMHNVMKYLGLSSMKLSELDTDAYNTISLAGEQFRIPNGKEQYVERLASYFPKEKDALKRYVDLIGKIFSSYAYNYLTSGQAGMTINQQYQVLPMDEVLDSLFKDEMLKSVVAGDMPLYAAQKGKTPFTVHAYIWDYYNNSAFRVEGGSDRISSLMADGIREMGGTILTKKKAVRIICDDTHATGVETLGETLYEADYVISAIHPNRMFEMLDTRLIRPTFRSRISSIPQTVGAFGLYVKYKDGKVPYMNTNLYSYNSLTPWGCENYDAESWPKMYLYMHMCHKDKAEYAQYGSVLTYMNMKDVEQWKGTSVGHRGENYEQFKMAHAQKLIENVEKEHPGFADSIDSFYTSTPLTYVDYTGTEDGSIYGALKDVSLGFMGHIPYKTKVPNLLLAGQNTNAHGMMGVIVGTIVTCSELVPPEIIFSQIDKAGKL